MGNEQAVPIRHCAVGLMLFTAARDSAQQRHGVQEQIMSMFKQFGDMAKMVKAAPGLIDQADGLAAQSEAYRARMDAQAVHAMTAQAAAGNLDPIAGVDLDVYARIVKGLAAFQYDETKLPVVAGMFGVDPSAWAEAQVGWGARI